MLVKIVIRAMTILLVSHLLGGWGGIAAQVQAATSSDVVSSSNPHASHNSKAQPAEIAATKSTPEVPAPDVATALPPSVNTKTHPEKAAELAPKDPTDPSYIVGIADELQISVWKEPDLSGPVVVRPDGMITVPVVDDVKVVGLTTKQVQDILTDKLKDVVAGPQVTVIVRGIHSRRVYLVGQVGRPGAVSLNGHETVLQILAESGGPGPYAKSDRIYILRSVGDHQEKLRFNYKKALKGGDPKADFQLENGDVIVVP